MWLLAKKKILSRNVRVRHAYLSQKYPYPQTPAPAISSFLQLGFWKLGCCVWRLFLETLKSNITVGDTVLAAGARMRFRTMVFGCHEASPLEVRLLPMKGKAIVQKHNHTGK